MLLEIAVSSLMEVQFKFLCKYISDCGIPNRADSANRIAGGSKAEIGEYPWQVWER